MLSISRIANGITDYLVSRGVIITFSLTVYAIAHSGNLQIVAIFTESLSEWDRVAATMGIAIAATVIFSIRQTIPLRKIILLDEALYLLPTLFIAFLPPWGDNGWVGGVIVVAVQAIVMLSVAAMPMSQGTKAIDKLLGTVIGAFIVLYFLFSTYRVDLARDLGAIAIGTLFLGLLAVLVELLRNRLRLFYFTIAWVAMSVFSYELQHEAKYQPLPQGERGIHAGARPFAQWLFDRADASHYRRAQLPYPVILVASEGGGGYAKAHAYTFLSKMAERCPNFNQHTFAMVGVSGGQIGNTLYHANLTDEETGLLTPCGNNVPESHSVYLATDHLSPLLGHLLFVEIPRKLLFLGPSEQGRTHVLLESFNDAGEGYVSVPEEAFEAHFWQDSGEGAYPWALTGRPAQVPVTVNVQTGNRFVFAPFRFESRGETYIDLFQATGHMEGVERPDYYPTIGSAALASASFPWVTPSLRFEWERPLTWIDEAPENAAASADTLSGAVNLVDGGYFENTGAETLSEIIASLSLEYLVSLQRRDGSIAPDESVWRRVAPGYRARSFDSTDGCDFLEGRVVQFMKNVEWAQCEVPYFFVTILVRNTPQPVVSGAPQSFLRDPVTTLLQTRSARGELAVATLTERRCGFADVAKCLAEEGSPVGQQLWHGILQSRVDSATMNLPLGWSMPAHRISAIERYVVPDANVCAQFVNEWGELDFATPHDETSLHDADLDLLVKRNCSHLAQLMLFFDPPALQGALEWRP